MTRRVVETDPSFEIDQCECPHGTGVETHILSEIVGFEFVCAAICRICKKRKVDDQHSKSPWRGDGCCRMVKIKRRSAGGGRTGGAWCIFRFVGSGWLFNVFQYIFGRKLACAQVRGGRDGKQMRTRFPFGEDDTTALEDSFEFVEVSKSRSVVPETVPVGVMASLTKRWMMRDCATKGEEQRGAHLCILGHCR